MWGGSEGKKAPISEEVDQMRKQMMIDQEKHKAEMKRMMQDMNNMMNTIKSMMETVLTLTQAVMGINTKAGSNQIKAQIGDMLEKYRGVAERIGEGKENNMQDSRDNRREREGIDSDDRPPKKQNLWRKHNDL